MVTKVVGASVPDTIRDLYERLSTLPAAVAREELARLDPAMRSAIWIWHTKEYIRLHPHLSQEQLAILDEAIQELATERPFIEASAVAGRPGDYGQLRRKAEQHFSIMEICAIFMSLGHGKP